MTLQTELVLVPITVVNEELRVFLVPQTKLGGSLGLPAVSLNQSFVQRDALKALMTSFFPQTVSNEVGAWMQSRRFQGRVIEVYDSSTASGQSTIQVVRAVAVPQDLAKNAQGEWYSFEEAAVRLEGNFVDRAFLEACQELVPFWSRMSTFTFEVLPAVFSIQDLRLLVSNLSKQEVDAGNFHRRLKRLDILTPLVSGQRVHRWEFAWEKTPVVSREGLLP